MDHPTSPLLRRDLSRFVRWPRNIHTQRQKKILLQLSGCPVEGTKDQIVILVRRNESNFVNIASLDFIFFFRRYLIA